VTIKDIVAIGVIGMMASFGHVVPTHAADKLSIVSNGQGSVNYTASLAIGTVLKQKAGIDSTVSPYAGPQVWLSLLDEGGADLGIANAIDVSQAMHGVPPNYKRPHKNLRLVSLTFSLLNGVVVRADSGIASLADARGKRVTGEYVAHQTCREISSGQLASVGLDWKDVKVMPVQSSAAGGEALKAGRVDVDMCAPIGQAVLQQIHVRTPLRFISVGHDEAAQKRFREHFPTGRAKLVPKGTSFGVEEDTWVWEYDFYLATGKQAKDEEIYKITQVLWESLPDLAKIAPLLRSMTHERMADNTASFTIPYHPGAIRFFKEKNVWSPTMEARQLELVKEASN
jgi:TRAP transporter TAXI family solute receptor